jgi:hypothetical protein
MRFRPLTLITATNLIDAERGRQRRGVGRAGVRQEATPPMTEEAHPAILDGV